MNITKQYRTMPVIAGLALILLVFLASPALAQYWTSLPPYNTLWPLWSPALSPVDPGTGLPTPIVSSLSPATVLPVQPGLTWDPAWTYPWLLYNTPAGLGYYDQIFGFNAWPPSHLFDPVAGTALPIQLKGTAWQLLAPFTIDWGQQFLPLANLTYAFLYGIDPAAFSLLLTPGAIWGL